MGTEMALNYILEPREQALISMAKDEDFVAGFMNLQALLHLEGLWVDPDYRGKVDFRMLVRQITTALPKGIEYYAFAPSWEIATICKYMHMQRTPWEVWKGST